MSASSPGSQELNILSTQAEQTQQNIIQLFRLIFQSIHKHSHFIERSCGVSATQLWALWELDKAKGMRVTQLADRLGIHKSTASNMLDKLEQKSLVRRERRSEDQRSVFLYLNPEGKELLNKAPFAAQGLVKAALEQSTDSENVTLKNALELLVNHFHSETVDVSRKSPLSTIERVE